MLTFTPPKSFPEFYATNPDFVRQLTKMFLGQCSKDVVDDLEQELLLHLMHLPPTSKWGSVASDRIAVFSHFNEYGEATTEAAFYGYVKRVCLRHFLSQKRDKQCDALARSSGIISGSDLDDGESGMTEGYVQQHRLTVAPALGYGFKRGQSPWNKGKSTGPRPVEIRQRISKTLKAISVESRFKKGMAPWNKGKKMCIRRKRGSPSEETKSKISASVKGYRWMFNLEHGRKHVRPEDVATLLSAGWILSWGKELKPRKCETRPRRRQGVRILSQIK